MTPITRRTHSGELVVLGHARRACSCFATLESRNLFCRDFCKAFYRHYSCPLLTYLGMWHRSPTWPKHEYQHDAARAPAAGFGCEALYPKCSCNLPAALHLHHLYVPTVTLQTVTYADCVF